MNKSKYDVYLISIIFSFYILKNILIIFIKYFIFNFYKYFNQDKIKCLHIILYHNYNYNIN